MVSEETKQVLRLSLTEFSLPKFYLLFGISKVKSAAVIAFRSSYRDRSFSPGSYERETFALSSLETVTEALLEIMEVSGAGGSFPGILSWKLTSCLCVSGLHEGHPRLQVVGPVDRTGPEVGNSPHLNVAGSGSVPGRLPEGRRTLFPLTAVSL